MLKNGISLLVILLFILNVQFISAQDKIVTHTNDTINCSIIRVTNKSVIFRYSDADNSLKSSLARSDIKSWEIDNINRIENHKERDSFQHGNWRFSFDTGLGHRIAGTQDSKQNLLNQGFDSKGVNSYFRQITTGLKATGQIHYMFWPNFGLGIDYQFHHSSGSLTGTIDPGDSYTLLYGELNDNVFTNYSGLSLYYQQWLNPKYKVYYQISMGLTFFRQESVFLHNANLITGSAFGGNSEIGLEYFLVKNLALSVNACFFQSTLSKINVNNGFSTNEIELAKEQREGLSRIDLGIGLKFYL